MAVSPVSPRQLRKRTGRCGAPIQGWKRLEKAGWIGSFHVQGNGWWMLICWYYVYLLTYIVLKKMRGFCSISGMRLYGHNLCWNEALENCADERSQYNTFTFYMWILGTRWIIDHHTAIGLEHIFRGGFSEASTTTPSALSFAKRAASGLPCCLWTLTAPCGSLNDVTRC